MSSVSFRSPAPRKGDMTHSVMSSWPAPPCIWRFSPNRRQRRSDLTHTSLR
jgi:hypothetical protein